ncbi:hypothetical protein LY78DRAFT_430840 [Colletotrichum sublineola]|nr:hypothetical protein LY78DRAFT_430840 [Colletotrichum sublineola]
MFPTPKPMTFCLYLTGHNIGLLRPTPCHSSLQDHHQSKERLRNPVTKYTLVLPKHNQSGNNQLRFAPGTAPCQSGTIMPNVTKTRRCFCNTAPVVPRVQHPCTVHGSKTEPPPRRVQITGLPIVTQYPVAANPASVASTTHRNAQEPGSNI